jgi:hypothetical protein
MPYQVIVDGSCCCFQDSGTGTGTGTFSSCLGIEVPETLYLCAYTYSQPTIQMWGDTSPGANCPPGGPGVPPFPPESPCYGFFTQQFELRFVPSPPGGTYLGVWSVAKWGDPDNPADCRLFFDLLINAFGNPIAWWRCLSLTGLIQFGGYSEAINTSTVESVYADPALSTLSPIHWVFRYDGDTCAGHYVISETPMDCGGTGSGTGTQTCPDCGADPGDTITLTVSDLGANECGSCAAANGAFTLTRVFDQPCEWVSLPFDMCGEPNTYWLVIYDSTNGYQLFLMKDTAVSMSFDSGITLSGCSLPHSFTGATSINGDCSSGSVTATIS